MAHPSETLIGDTGSDTPLGGALDPVDHLALVVLWARHEAARIGEVFLVPTTGGPWVVGRPGEGEGRRLAPVRREGATWRFGGELEEPRMSRTQLALEVGPGRVLRVTNLGKRDVLVGERRLTRGEATEAGDGALIEVDRQLLLGVAARWELGALPALLPPFGGVDGVGLVGESPAVWALRRQIEVAARRQEHVLIHGASGTGKEVVARAIHARSSRGARPLVSRSAASIPESLVEAELFGNSEGFPNPGMKARPGLVGEADGSTLFIDEIGEISHEVQARLLRVMDAGEYTRLGEARPRRADLRVVAATNRPLGSLKHDLTARFPIQVYTPGLETLRLDLPLLARHLVRELATADNGARFLSRSEADGTPRLSLAFTRHLVQRPWSTHVRELRRLLLAALSESPGPWVEPPGAPAEGPRPAPDPLPEPAAVFTAEERRRLDALRRAGFNAALAAADPTYPTNRQNAALSLNVFFARALRAAAWDPDRAVALLLDTPDPAASRAASRRLRALLTRERETITAHPLGSPEAEAHHRADLRRYGIGADDLWALRRALQDGLVDDKAP